MLIQQTILRYLYSCGLLLLPAMLWNVAFIDRLPPAIAGAEFWRDIPVPLALAENSLRLIVFALPFAMPLELSTPLHRRGLLVFVLGTLVYFVSWLVLMASPDSPWSRSAVGFLAPAYTPALWLIGLAMLGRRLYWGSYYRWWMYLLISGSFLVAHISHAGLVYGRNY